MAIKTTTNIDIDFCDKKYVLVNAKQLDRNSRFLSVTCYNHGELFYLNSGDHAAYVRYRKADDYGVFNNCDIDRLGKVIVELTEQMLAADGICYADLVIVNKGDAVVDPNTGEIDEIIANASVLSSMTFCIDVSEVPVANAEIESMHEFILLNENLEKYWANFEDVMKTSKSWAVGHTGIRDGENTNNSEYWSEQSKASASNAKTSETNASVSESNAKVSETNAKTSETNAASSEEKAKLSEVNSQISETNASNSEFKAKKSEESALNYSVASQRYAVGGTNSVDNESVDNAKYYYEQSLKNAESSSESATVAIESIESTIFNANLAMSYAVGSSGIRENEDKDNARYYYEMTKSVADGLNSGFIPMGTIKFEDLATAEKATGFTYNIHDDFVTDNTFKEGEGKPYTAGTNVYYTADGYWDCFGGAASPTATVDEVKDYLGINIV